MINKINIPFVVVFFLQHLTQCVGEEKIFYSPSNNKASVVARIWFYCLSDCKNKEKNRSW